MTSVALIYLAECYNLNELFGSLQNEYWAPFEKQLDSGWKTNDVWKRIMRNYCDEIRYGILVVWQHTKKSI